MDWSFSDDEDVTDSPKVPAWVRFFFCVSGILDVVAVARNRSFLDGLQQARQVAAGPAKRPGSGRPRYLRILLGEGLHLHRSSTHPPRQSLKHRTQKSAHHAPTARAKPE